MARPNTGSVFELPKGSGIWHAQATVDGRKVRRKGGPKSHANRLLRQLLDLADNNAVPKDGRRSVGSFLKDWLDWVKDHRHHSTYGAYEQAVRLIIAPGIGTIPLMRLTADDIEKMMRRALAAGHPVKQVNKSKTVLHTALKYAATHKLVIRNVADTVEKLPLPFRAVEPTRAMEPEQIVGFLEVASRHRLGVMFLMTLLYGLRKGEITGHKWDDIKYVDGVVHIRRQVRRLNGMGNREGAVKGGRPRVVPLLPFLAAELRTWYSVLSQEKSIAGSRWKEAGYTFPNTIGGPLEQSNLSKAFDELLAEAGLPHFRFHDLRHSCSTFMDMLGIPDRVRADILGHRHVQMTQHYTHALPGQVVAAGELMDKFIRDLIEPHTQSPKLLTQTPS